MTAPIVHPTTWKRLLRQEVFATTLIPPRLSAEIAIARRDFDAPPKGQLWERLAEATVEDVQWRRVYFPKLRAAVNRALRNAETRRAADALRLCGDSHPLIIGPCNQPAGHDAYHWNSAGFFWERA